MEIPLSIEIKKTRWRAFDHMLRLHEKTPCHMAMTDHFRIPPNSKRYLGRKRFTPPIKSDEDLKEAERIILNSIKIRNNLRRFK